MTTETVGEGAGVVEEAAVEAVVALGAGTGGNQAMMVAVWRAGSPPRRCGPL